MARAGVEMRTLTRFEDRKFISNNASVLEALAKYTEQRFIPLEGSHMKLL
jgi:hypothetical protein